MQANRNGRGKWDDRVPDFEEDNRLELALCGDIDAIFKYAMRYAQGERVVECHEATVQIVEGTEERAVSEYRNRHPQKPRRKLTADELAALKGLFGNGAVFLSDVYEHAGDTPELSSALDLLFCEGPTNLDVW